MDITIWPLLHHFATFKIVEVKIMLPCVEVEMQYNAVEYMKLCNLYG